MENKTKAIISIVVILLIIVGAGVYVSQKSKSVATQNIAPIVTQQPTPATTPVAVANVEAQKVGTVSMVTATSITIEEVGGSFQAAITKNTTFLKRDGSAKTKATVADVKVGTNVILKFNTNTGEISEVEII
jgi:hypothetical protein